MGYLGEFLLATPGAGRRKSACSGHREGHNAADDHGDAQRPQNHGPYFQLSYVHQGKSTTQVIPKSLVPPVVHQLDNYKTFKALTTESSEITPGVVLATTGRPTPFVERGGPR